MAKLGAPKELIAELNQSRIIDVLPVNWPVVVWFNQVGDLMRWRSDGQCLGLDLQQVQSEAAMSQRDYTPAQFNGLRIMSVAAARTTNKG